MRRSDWGGGEPRVAADAHAVWNWSRRRRNEMRVNVTFMFRKWSRASQAKEQVLMRFVAWLSIAVEQIDDGELLKD